MPTKTKRVKTPVKKTKPTSDTKVASLNVIPGGKLNNVLNKYTDKIINFKKSRNFYIVLIIAGLLLVAVYKKNWFVAATVNGVPVTNLELQMHLNQQFRTQTLNQLINEKIILNEAAKNQVIVPEAEVNNKIAEIESSVGGPQALDAMLSQQGQNRSSIRNQIKLQLTIEKLYANEATVSAEEVTKFIEQNKDQLKATDSAGQQKEAADALKNQKLSQTFSQKFQELRTKAKIQIF